MGEGWHNYHHVFPWDYKAAELGQYSLNVTTALIDMFSLLGWAYDLREPAVEMVRCTVEKQGDGSHPNWRSRLEEVTDDTMNSEFRN
jgi:stearoyl-CoA desaturase (delta-9 desaturase)